MYQNKKMKLSRANTFGFGLVGVLVTMFMVSVIAASVTAVILNFLREQDRINILFNIQQIQKNLSTLLSNDDVWRNVVLNNSGLECMRPLTEEFTPPLCNSGITGNLKLFTAAGAAYFDSNTQGFTLNGMVCTLGGSGCSLNMEIKAKLTCPSETATCTKPDMVSIEGAFRPFSTADGRSFVFNPNKYKVQVVKDNVLGGLGSTQKPIFRIESIVQSFLAGGGPLGTCHGNSTSPPGFTIAAFFCLPLSCPTGTVELLRYINNAKEVFTLYVQGTGHSNSEVVQGQVRICESQKFKDIITVSATVCPTGFNLLVAYPKASIGTNIFIVGQETVCGR